jgi:mannose-6-phosphate isomerase-like protein (cupin superfamily)
MNIFNKLNTFNTGDLKILKSYTLIGCRNVKNAKISIQISDIPINSEQPIHNHEPEQCYYIIHGKGLMTIEKEQAVVKHGDAIFVPSNKKHGIKNMGNETLEYLTANYPAFDEIYEKALWPCKP